jgi:hypothetical protein
MKNSGKKKGSSIAALNVNPQTHKQCRTHCTTKLDKFQLKSNFYLTNTASQTRIIRACIKNEIFLKNGRFVEKIIFVPVLQANDN